MSDGRNDGGIRIVIGEDDAEVREYFSAKINEQSDMKIVGAAQNGLELLKYIERTKPDVVIMDIVLRELDGFGVLNELQKRGNMGNIIVFSCLCGNQVVSEINKYGIKYFLPKPVFSERLIEIIRSVNGEKRGEKSGNETETPAKDSVRMFISDILRLLGVSAHLKGYRFLRKAIEFNIVDMSMAEALTKELYPAVAAWKSTTWTSVERSISTALDDAWNSGDAGEWFERFGCSKLTRGVRPSNKQVIITICEEINLRFKDIQFYPGTEN